MQSIPLLAGAAFLLTLGVWSTARTVPEIEQDVETRLAGSLESEGAPFHRVSAYGRNVEVFGVPASHLPVVTEQARALWGIGAVNVREDLGRGSWLRVLVRDGIAHVEGVLEGSDLEARVRTGARAAPGGRSIRFDLAVDAERPEPVSWPTSFVPLFTAAGRGIGELSLTLDDEVLVVEGETIYAAAVDSLGAQLFGAAPGIQIRNLLEEAPDFPSRLEAALSGPGIAFEPNTSRLSRGSWTVLARIVQALRHGEGNIVVTGRWTDRGPGGRRLAAARVGVVLDYFAAHGVDPGRTRSTVVASDGAEPVLSINADI